jgi:hypothetical protein
MRSPIHAELESLRNNEAFRRLLLAAAGKTQRAKDEAILGDEDADVMRGRARGMMELLAFITPE